VTKMKSEPKLGMATITGRYAGSRSKIKIDLDLILDLTPRKCE
jgi:hypothetical protein